MSVRRRRPAPHTQPLPTRGGDDATRPLPVAPMKAEPSKDPAEPSLRRGSLLSTRARLLAWMLVPTLIGLALILLVMDRSSLARISHSANADVAQEIEEFTTFAQTGVDPVTGKGFTSADALLEEFMTRQRLGPGETLLGQVGDTTYSLHGPRTGELSSYEPLDDEQLLAATEESPNGVYQRPRGEVRWSRVELQTSDGGTARLIVLHDTTEDLREARATIARLAWTIASVALVITVLTWIVAGRILAPIAQMRRTAAEITQADLTTRMPVRGDDDLAALARTFNGLLDRLEEAFLAQKKFVNDASHELKTPITIIRGHLEVMGDSEAEREATLSLVTRELDRMSRMVSDLLALAKAERPDFIQPIEGVEVADLTMDIDAKASALGDRRWQLREIADGTCTLDVERLSQAVLQLCQNAVQHTQDGDIIQLATRFVTEDGQPWLQFEVLDTGPGVPLTERERIFGRFSRGSSAMSSKHRRAGAGLGLAIVRAIAEGHGGWVKVMDHAGKGARFVLAVPALDAHNRGPEDDDDVVGGAHG